jgi:hypothetical protein
MAWKAKVMRLSMDEFSSGVEQASGRGSGRVMRTWMPRGRVLGVFLLAFEVEPGDEDVTVAGELAHLISRRYLISSPLPFSPWPRILGVVAGLP